MATNCSAAIIFITSIIVYEKRLLEFAYKKEGIWQHDSFNYAAAIRCIKRKSNKKNK